MTFVFYVSRPTFFENQCGSAEKTNKSSKNKHGTSQRKCEMWWSRSVRLRYHWSTTPLMKNSSFLTGHRLAVQRKKTNKGRPLEQISSAAFSRLLSLSLSRPWQWARTPTYSEWTCAREWSSDGRTSSSFFSVKVNVLPTTAITQNKLF